jgi:hypothetical protein
MGYSAHAVPLAPLLRTHADVSTPSGCRPLPLMTPHLPRRPSFQSLEFQARRGEIELHPVSTRVHWRCQAALRWRGRDDRAERGAGTRAHGTRGGEKTRRERGRVRSSESPNTHPSRWNSYRGCRRAQRGPTALLASLWARQEDPRGRPGSAALPREAVTLRPRASPRGSARRGPRRRVWAVFGQRRTLPLDQSGGRK